MQGLLTFIKKTQTNKHTQTTLATWRRMDWRGTKVDGEEPVRGYFRSLSKSYIGLDWVIAVEMGRSQWLGCVCKKQRKMWRSVLKNWPWPNVRTVRTSGWKRVKFSGKACKFSLGNTELRVAVSHPSRYLRKQLTTLLWKSSLDFVWTRALNLGVINEQIIGETKEAVPRSPRQRTQHRNRRQTRIASWGTQTLQRSDKEDKSIEETVKEQL